MENSSKYWVCIKVSFLYYWLTRVVSVVLFQSNTVDTPIGIYEFVHYGFLFTGAFKYISLAIILMISFLYITERYMKWALLIMSVFSVLLITYHESQGVFLRNTAYSMILIVQFLAYLIKDISPGFNLKTYRIQFPVQIIAANYFLAALSKLQASGLSWITEGKYFSLQVLKGFYYRYFDTGDIMYKQLAWEKTDWFLSHLDIITFLLAFSLFLEFFSWVALLGRKYRIAMGFMLVGMHLGIKWGMNIVIGAMVANMVIFYLNPLYYVYRIIDEVKVKYWVKT